jgi:dihydroorotate dehydrogenase electron transfer subunit
VESVRVILPGMPLDVEAPVLRNDRLSAVYNVVSLEAPAIAEGVQPGQFVMLKMGSGHDPLLRRPFSVFEVVRDDRGAASGISVLSKRVGRGTGWLFGALPGQAVRCFGPLGRPFTTVDPPTEAWMVAGGVGLAPFATLAEALRRRATPTTLFYGGRTAGDLFFTDLFERLGARTLLATEDGSRGFRGLITTVVREELGKRSPNGPLMIYACGPEAMLAVVTRIAREHGRPSEVAMERTMGCGLGGCYSCVVRVRRDDGQTHYVRSCVEGPVFRGEDIVWE